MIFRKNKYKLNASKRAALLLEAPNVKWLRQLEEEMLNKFAKCPPFSEVNDGFENWVNSGSLDDAKTVAQLLSVCETQNQNVKTALYEAVMELPDILFESVVYMLGYRASGVHGKQRSLLLKSDETIRSLYQVALNTIANTLVENAIDERANMVIPIECVLFVVYDLSLGGNRPVALAELTYTIGCSDTTVLNHGKILSAYGLIVIDELEWFTTLTDKGKGLAERMRASGRCWLGPGVVLRHYIDTAFTGDLTDLSRETEIPVQNLCGILDGNYGISVYEAHGLAQVFDRPAQYWISLQELYNNS